MLTELDIAAARAALEWQFEMGVDEAIADTPVNRFDQPKSLPKMGASSNIRPVARIPDILPKEDSAADVARIMASKTADLAGLRDAMAVFEHCALKKGARNLVFADGNPQARVMVIGEAPGRDEDMQGKPFVGRAGQLLDRMFAAIGLTRTEETPQNALYITNVMPWRPPQNRDPLPEEVAMMLPFLEQHIKLANPELLVLMGNTACKAVLGRSGITRLRGNWTEAFGKPVMPMFHPAALLRDGHKKRDAWADLLAIKARLGG